MIMMKMKIILHYNYDEGIGNVDDADAYESMQWRL